MTQQRKSIRDRARDFVHYRSRFLGDRLSLLFGRVKHGAWRRLVAYEQAPDGVKLHVGSGRVKLDGWTNLDLQPLMEVDVRCDVTEALPFERVSRIFAEHFLEHLEVDRAIGFLAKANEILAPGGRIRLSTPNLDWVWTTNYELPSAAGRGDRGARILRGIAANRAFYCWRHRFLWNRELLAAAMQAAGFADLRWYGHGESDDPLFAGLERHETYSDTPDLPHILIVEGTKGRFERQAYQELLATLGREFLSMRDD